MEIIIAVILHIRRTNPCISHDGGGTPGFVGSRTPVAGIILSMIAAKLVAHFMADIVDVKRVSHRSRKAGYPTCLVCIVTRRIEEGNATTTCTEYMADVIVAAANDGVYSRLIFEEHSSAIVVGVRVGSGVQLNQEVIIGDHFHTDGNFTFVHAIDAIHRSGKCCHNGCNRTPMESCVFARTGQSQSIGSQLTISRHDNHSG